MVQCKLFDLKNICIICFLVVSCAVWWRCGSSTLWECKLWQTQLHFQQRHFPKRDTWDPLLITFATPSRHREHRNGYGNGPFWSILFVLALAVLPSFLNFCRDRQVLKTSPNSLFFGAVNPMNSMEQMQMNLMAGSSSAVGGLCEVVLVKHVKHVIPWSTFPKHFSGAQTRGLPGMQNMDMQNMQAAMFMNAMQMNAMNGMNGMNGMNPMNMSGSNLRIAIELELALPAFSHWPCPSMWGLYTTGE